eukprot:TRINITY_DN2468_c0_g1_i3.p1 TRINITY_DN2468_c0_g1~~TRINITY_DN2468_c0_g1_i3.p1  ORF type:complete len:426 (-),score=165.27 TRINITY_DN2468_c0_g1_i3:100-1377(-)
MIRRPPRSTQSRSSAASDVYKRQQSTGGSHDKTMKLLLIASALVAVAFAAPRTNMVDSIVPEEMEMAQVDDLGSVDDLKQQFTQLQAQLKGGLEYTRGVKAIVGKMTSMITNRIEPAINQAHAADQSILNSKMRIIGSLNSGLTSDVNILNKEANTVRHLIDNQQAAAAAWKKSAAGFTSQQATYLSTFQAEHDSCCNRDNAAVVDVQYVPAFKECDYTKSPACSADARKAVSSIVTSPFTEGLATYRKLVQECTDLTADLAKENHKTDVAIRACGADKRSEQGASDIATTEQRRVEREWEKTISKYNNNFAVKISDYQISKKAVKAQEADRKSEWQATQQIKCLLNAYARNGGFDRAAQAKCTVKIKTRLHISYPTEIKQLKPKLAPFEKQTNTDSHEDTCNKRTPAPVRVCQVRKPRPTPICK